MSKVVYALNRGILCSNTYLHNGLSVLRIYPVTHLLTGVFTNKTPDTSRLSKHSLHAIA